MNGNGNASSPCRDTIYEKIDRALQRWGKRTYHDYAAFQPVITLSLTIVEKKAKEILATEIKKSGHPRKLTDRDRQYAIWHLIKTAIETLKPHNSELATEVVDMLENLPGQEWPDDLHVPQECFSYLTLSYAYVWKSKPNKQIALLFNVSERTLANIRSKAVLEVAQRLCEWEEHAKNRAVTRSSPQQASGNP